AGGDDLAAFAFHIAQGDDVLVGDVGQVIRPLPTDADDAQMEFLVRRGLLFLRGERAGGRGQSGAGLQKPTAGEIVRHCLSSPRTETCGLLFRTRSVLCERETASSGALRTLTP